ncbi:MAG: tetratricopeptide repeat protein [Pararhodobacter sp.]
MIRRIGLALGLAALLAACQTTTDFTPDRLGGSGNAVAEAADGLAVGHRLMAAGEYDLALRAYYRAAAQRGPGADVLSAIGSANLRLGRLGQAEQMLRRSLDLDPAFVPALNNLGVVKVEQRRWGEARHLFQSAFALDSGRSPEIRENLRLAIANLENSGYTAENNYNFALVRRGNGRFLLLSTP